jgi:3-methyl-2-oxobutanoate hydroxymethyltransferase
MCRSYLSTGNFGVSSQAPLGKITLNKLQAFKQTQQKFAMVTAYDATFAHWASSAGIETLLVGDSLGMVLQGRESTLSVTLEHMAYHTQMVAQGNLGSWIIADMPFMTINTPESTLDNAARLMQAGAHMVKIEGAGWLADTISLLAERGVPVCAHLGLTPQSVHKLGGYRVQGREDAAAEVLFQDAKVLEEAGADMLLLECVPMQLAKRITEHAGVPVVGIGAGPDTDAQVLVMHDLLGLTVGRTPKFAQTFMTEGRTIQEAFAAYAEAVREGRFPALEQGFV